MSGKDTFFGHFYDGILSDLGTASYGNRIFYYGQFFNGDCLGYACVEKNGKILFQFSNEEIEEE